MIAAVAPRRVATDNPRHVAASRRLWTVRVVAAMSSRGASSSSPSLHGLAASSPRWRRDAWPRTVRAVAGRASPSSRNLQVSAAAAPRGVSADCPSRRPPLRCGAWPWMVRGVAAAGDDEPSSRTLHCLQLRRRREAWPRNLHVVAAAVPRRVSDYQRRNARRRRRRARANPSRLVPRGSATAQRVSTERAFAASRRSAAISPSCCARRAISWPKSCSSLGKFRMPERWEGGVDMACERLTRRIDTCAAAFGVGMPGCV